MNDDAKNKGRPEVKLEAYKDLAQPAGRILGDVLGKVASLALEPVGALADIGKANLMRFVKKLEKEERENPENIIPTKPSVAVPILEKMRYNDEDALAEAYAELLKNSCLKDRQAKVLPAYSEILARLSPDEVKILDCINSGGVSYRLHGKSVWYDGFPFVEIRNKSKHAREWLTVESHFNDLDQRVILSNSENMGTYIDNLIALRIFSVDHGVEYKPVSIYENLERDASRLYQSKIEQVGRVMDLNRGAISLTNLAKSFLAMCTSNRHNGESNAPTS